MKRFCLLAIVIFLMAGCARVEITKILDEKSYKEGLRFYRPHPYLWVTKDPEGALQSTIIWLPNKKEEYVIKVKGGIGTVSMTGTLENGWNLTEFGETRDSKTPEMITALTGSLQEITRKGLVKKDEFIPGLYKFIFDVETGLIKDLKPVVQFMK
jgi:hypothetical protein